MRYAPPKMDLAMFFMARRCHEGKLTPMTRRINWRGFGPSARCLVVGQHRNYRIAKFERDRPTAIVVSPIHEAQIVRPDDGKDHVEYELLVINVFPEAVTL